MKKILYITFLLFCACYISSCSEDRYYPGEIYQDVDDNGGDDGDDVVEKVNENLAKGGAVLVLAGISQIVNLSAARSWTVVRLYCLCWKIKE